MPKLTPPEGATSSPGGSGVSKEVGGGTGRGEHDSLPKRAPPSGEHTDTTQQRDGGHPRETVAKAAVNPLANLKGAAADRLRSSNFAKAAPAASYKIYDEYDRNVAGQDWQVVQHKRHTRPIDPKQLPPKKGSGRQAFWARHNEEHHKEGALGCGVKGCKWETNVRRQAGGHKRATNKPYDRPHQPSSTPGGSTSTAPRSAPASQRPAQTPGPTPSLQRLRAVIGSLIKAPPDPCPHISMRTTRCLNPPLQDHPRPLEETLLRLPEPIHRRQGQVRLFLSRSPCMSTRASHKRNLSRSRNSIRGGSRLLIVPFTLCSIRNSEVISRFST